MTDQERPKSLDELLELIVEESTKDEDERLGQAIQVRKKEIDGKLVEEIRSLREQNEDRRENRNLRKKYAGWVYYYLVGYSLSCLVLLLLSGGVGTGFFLPESVLDFLVGSTAVSAIGLVYAVVQGLFNSKDPKS